MSFNTGFLRIFILDIGLILVRLYIRRSDSSCLRWAHILAEARTWKAFQKPPGMCGNSVTPIVGQMRQFLTTSSRSSTARVTRPSPLGFPTPEHVYILTSYDNESLREAGRLVEACSAYYQSAFYDSRISVGRQPTEVPASLSWKVGFFAG